MSLAHTAAIAATALFLSCGSATAAGPYRPFQIGLWSGGAYTDDRTGSFSHCSAGVVYDSGINMFVVSTEAHGWWLGFTSPRWSLTANASIPVKLQFDARPPVEILATIADGQLLLVPMPEDSHLIDTFRHSSKIAVIAQEQSFSLSLAATSVVMSELTNCVRGSVALDTRSLAAPPGPSAPAVPNPAPAASTPPAPAVPTPALAASIPLAPAASTPPPPASSTPPQTTRTLVARDATELEEMKLARNFLLAVGLPNAHLIDTDKPAALASFTAVWRSEGAAGAVKIIPPGREVTGSGIASDLISVDPKLCKGNFAAARSSDVVDGGVVFRAVLSCAEGQDDRTAQYFITPRRKGGFVVFAVIGAHGGSPPNPLRADVLGRAALQAVAPGD